MYKKLIVILLPFAIVSCIKKDNTPCTSVNTTAPASEVASLRTYIQSNSITATEDARGFFYRIDIAGSGSKPTACSGVTVNYIGTFTNGSTFDSGNNASFSLSGVITGWQEGVPLIGTGGTIYLYLPPSLAYGSTAQNGIPPNSILIFKIDLKAVN